jgi:hypothetical protein
MLPERTMRLLGLSGQQFYKSGMMRLDIEIIYGDLIGGKNTEQGRDDAGVEQHETFTVTRLLQGDYGLKQPRQIHIDRQRVPPATTNAFPAASIR